MVASSAPKSFNDARFRKRWKLLFLRTRPGMVMVHAGDLEGPLAELVPGPRHAGHLAGLLDVLRDAPLHGPVVRGPLVVVSVCELLARERPRVDGLVLYGRQLCAQEL